MPSVYTSQNYAYRNAKIGDLTMTQPQQCLICRGVGKHKPIRNLSRRLVGCPLDSSGDSALQCQEAKLRVERELELDRIGKSISGVHNWARAPRKGRGEMAEGITINSSFQGAAKGKVLGRNSVTGSLWRGNIAQRRISPPQTPLYP